MRYQRIGLLGIALLLQVGCDRPLEVDMEVLPLSSTGEELDGLRTSASQLSVRVEGEPVTGRARRWELRVDGEIVAEDKVDDWRHPSVWHHWNTRPFAAGLHDVEVVFVDGDDDEDSIDFMVELIDVPNVLGIQVDGIDGDGLDFDGLEYNVLLNNTADGSHIGRAVLPSGHQSGVYSDETSWFRTDDDQLVEMQDVVGREMWAAVYERDGVFDADDFIASSEDFPGDALLSGTELSFWDVALLRLGPGRGPALQ